MEAAVILHWRMRQTCHTVERAARKVEWERCDIRDSPFGECFRAPDFELGAVEHAFRSAPRSENGAQRCGRDCSEAET